MNRPQDSNPHPEQADGLPQPYRTIAFCALIVGVTSIIMDGVAIAMALPRIAADLGAEPATVTWVVNIYQVALIAFMLPSAALGQILGYRPVYLTGMALFGGMAALSATAESLTVLATARGLQGLGAALALSVNLALLRYIVPANRLARSLGINAMSVALAATAGPSVAGVVLTYADWHWVMALFAPLALVAMLGGALTFPDSLRTPSAFDLPSAALSAATFGSLLIGLSGIGHQWPAWAILGLFGMGTGCGLLLWRRARASSSPLLPVDLLRIPAFRLSTMASVCGFATQMLIYVALPFYLQQTLGLSVLQAGIMFSLWPLALACCAPIAGGAAGRVGPDALCVTGFATLAAGLMVLSLAGALASTALCAVGLVLCGAGFGLFQTPNNHVMMTSAPRARASAASASLGTARLLGQALGTAMAATTLALGVEAGWPIATLLGAVLAATGAAISHRRRAA